MSSRNDEEVAPDAETDAVGLAHLSPDPAALSRRTFIASMGALASGVAYGADGACLPGELSVCRVPNPRLPLLRQTVRVTLNGESWEIKPPLFGPDARASISYLPADGRYVIRLSRAVAAATDLRMGFTAVLYQSAGNWVVRLNFAVVGREIDIPLDAWIQGGKAAYAGDLHGIDKIGLAYDRCMLRPLQGRFQVSISSLLEVELSAPDGIACTVKTLKFSAAQAILTPIEERDPDTDPAPGEGRPFALVRLNGLSMAGEGLALIRIGRTQQARLFSQPFDAVLGRSSASSGKFLLWVLATAKSDQPAGSKWATLEVSGGAAGPRGARIQLSSWSIIGEIGKTRDELEFQAEVESAAVGGLGLEADKLVAVISGKADSGSADHQRSIYFPLFEDAPFLSFRTALCEVHLPLAGASSASLELQPRQDVIVRFGQPLRESKRPQDVALLEIGPQHSLLTLSLDHGSLRVRRSADNFDLRFRLLNYHLRVERGASTIVPRLLPVTGGEAWPKAPTMVVEFPPQHLFEEAFLDSEWKPPHPDSLPASNNGRPWKKDPARRWLNDRDPDLARTLLANGSRIVFKMQGEQPASGTRLTLEWLTDWNHRSLEVDARALPRAAGLKEQLGFVHIAPTTTLLEARKKIRNSMTGEPGRFSTAIEPVYRLIVSPDSSAHFLAPSSPPDARHPVLWTAELDNDPRIAVRALHARGMDGWRDFVGDSSVPGSYQPDPFTGSLSASDRLEIVVMSSFYGVPALRRLLPENPSAFQKIRALFIDQCGDRGWKDDPNGMVFYPDDAPYQYLDPLKVCGVPQEGVMVAKPFDRFTLRLGRGADLDLLWQGEPPAPGPGKFFPEALNIERYRHRAVQGRDAFVEVLYKGFLFPLGHRVSYIKVTYRDYKAYLNDPLGDPTAYLVQEYYIVSNKPRKLFKAYDQPFDSRDFPCESVTLLTVKTPKLADPWSPKGSQEWVGKVFWPALANGGTPISFALQIDGQAEPAHTQLLFVDNSAAHDQATMQAVTAYYNGEINGSTAHRTVSHDGAVRRYGVEAKPGDSSFRTRDWLLAARGRIADDGSETFSMDAFMEGQDQPPFYPVVEEASVNVESVERLTGKLGLYITTAYNANYVRHGFERSRNPSEIYLDVIRPDLPLDGNDSQGATGGVASMAALLAGLSRSVGPVGGRRRPPASTPARMLADAGPQSPGVGGRAERTYDMAAAQAGSFDPLEYLGGAFNDAKLLGCIPLKDVLKTALIAAAPKLVEEARHGLKGAVGDVRAMAEKLRTALLEGLEKVSSAVKALRGKANEELAKQSSGLSSELSLAALYPELDQAMQSLEELAEQAEAQLGSTADIDLGALQSLASDLTAGVNGLLKAIEALARDPVPSIVRDTLLKFQTIWTSIRDPFGTIVETFKDEVNQIIHRELITPLCGPDTRHLLTLMFGPQASGLPGETPDAYCRRMAALLQHPAEALESMRDALLYDMFSKPLFELVNALAGRLQQGSKALAWSRQRVIVLITGTIRRESAALPSERLTLVAEKVANAIDTAVRGDAGTLEQLPQAIGSIVQAGIESAKQDLDATLLELESEFSKECRRLHGEIRQALQEQAAGLVTAEMEQKYNELLNLLRFAEDRWSAANSLLRKIRSTEWNRLVAAVVAEVKQEFARAVDEQLAALKKEVRTAFESRLASMAGVFGQALALVAQSEQMRALAERGEQLGELCANASSDLRMLLDTAAVKLTPTTDLLDAKLKQANELLMAANTELIRLRLPHGTPASVRDTMGASFSTLMTAMGQLRQLLAEFAGLREKWGKQFADCKPNQVFDALGNIVALRARICEAVVNALSAGRACIGSLEFSALLRDASVDVFRSKLAAAVELLGSLLGDITGLVNVGASADYDTFKTRLNAIAGQGSDKFAQLEKLADDLRGAGAKVQLDLAARIRDEFARINHYLSSLVVQLVTPRALLDKLAATMTPLAVRVADLLLPVHRKVLGSARELADIFDMQGPAGMSLANVLSPELVAEFARAIGALEADNKSLQSIKDSTAAPDGSNPVVTLAERLAKDQTGLAQLVRLVGRIAELVTSGNAASVFINASVIEKQLRDAILSFVPTKVDLRYDFDAPLSDFPASDPIFTMDRASFGTQKEISYAGDQKHPKNDLVLSTLVNIDLMTGERVVRADGRIRPFTLNLLGSFDLIGISFGGAHFEAVPGKPMAFDTTITGVRIGAMLEFLTLIQSYFSSGNENGLYYELQFLPPAIEVGYRFNKSLIAIGSMLLLNVGFRVGARLPLDDRQAEFFAQMSSREHPLLIVMTPYGGGGFFSLRSSARGIVSFEIQFEFGFVGAVEFGPLTGQARATAGIYLMQGNGTRVLEGFVHAVGEGQIACFGIGVNVEIRMRQEGDGAMQGSTTMKYSFSVGFYEVEFEFEAQRRQDNGTGGGGARSNALSSTRGAQQRLQGSSLAAPAGATIDGPAHCREPGRRSILRSKALDKQSQWGRYKQTIALEEPV